jgi:hypothetical protein
MGPQRDRTGPPGDSARHGFGDLVRPGGAVGFPCVGVAFGGPGVTVGVGLLVGDDVVGGVVEDGVVGRSPTVAVGVVLGSVV